VRSSRGQASVDYVALLGLVTMVFALGAGAVGAPWLAPRLTAAIRHGICVVSGSLCTPGEARRAGAEPCVVHRVRSAERAGATAVIRLGRGDAMVVERRSDGTVAVSFVDGGELGVEGGLGLRLPVGLKASAVGGLGVRFNHGRVYELPDWGAAQRFLARVAAQERLGGEAKRALQALCRRCPEWVEGAGAAQPPPPSATFLEGGRYADLSARLGLRVPGLGSFGESARAESLRVVGRRVAGDRTTYYLRLDGTATAHLGIVLGSLAGSHGQEGALEVTLAGGQLVDVRARLATSVASGGELLGARMDLGRLVDRLRAAAAAAPADGRGGLALEASAGLDLSDPADRRAVEALLSPGLSPQGWIERVRAFGRRLDSAGRVDLAVLRAQEDSGGREAGVGALVQVGAGYRRSQSTRELLAAWSLRAGELRRREDCEAAAAATAAA